MPKRLLSFFVAALPILGYFLYLFRFSVPFPNEDDLPVIFAFINRAFPFDDASLRLFFTPFREHVILPAKIVAYVQVLLSGCVDLRTMVLLGNLCWVRVAWLLFSTLRDAKVSPLYFVPVPFILFQAQFTETALWPMAVLSNMVVIWLAYESIHLLVNAKGKVSRWQFILAFFCTAAATFSNGNGLLSILMGLGILIVQRAGIARIFGWALAGGLAVSGYVWTKSLGLPDGTYGIQNHPLRWLWGVCLFVGSYGDVISGSFKWLATGLGATLLGTLFFLNVNALRQARYRSSVTFTLSVYALFALLTAAAVALLRTEPVGVDSALLGRYRHYSALLVAIGYLLVCVHLQKKQVLLRRFSLLFLGISIAVGTLSYYRDWGYRYMDYQKFWADTYNMQHNNVLYLNWKAQNGLPAIYRSSLAQNVLCLPGTPLINVTGLKSDSLQPIIPTTLEWETVMGDSARCGRVATVKTDTLRFELDKGEAWLWMLKSDQQTYFVSATALKTNPVQLITTQQYFKPGFSGAIPVCFLPQGIYQLFLVNARIGQPTQVFRTGKFVQN